MTVELLDPNEHRSLVQKQAHWADIREKLKQTETVEHPPHPGVRSITDYPLGKFENLERSRLRWVAPNWFEFVPKSSKPFSFVRSSGERITPKNFFTDGGSIPRLFQWSNDLDPFGSL